MQAEEVPLVHHGLQSAVHVLPYLGRDDRPADLLHEVTHGLNGEERQVVTQCKRDGEQPSRKARPEGQPPQERGEGPALGGHADHGALRRGQRLGADQGKHGGLTKSRLVLTLRGAGAFNVYIALSNLCQKDTTEMHIIQAKADDEADKKIIFVTIFYLNSMPLPPLIPAK